jgi:hypothetical protein
MGGIDVCSLVVDGRTLSLTRRLETRMYLFLRTTRLAPAHLLDGMEWASAVTEKVNQVTSLTVRVWTPVMSPGVGTLSWGCFVETLSDLEAAETKLLADPIYLDLVKQGAELTTGGMDDATAQLLSPIPAKAIDPTHVTVVMSQLANGNFQRGVAVGLEIAAEASRLSGLDTSFLLATTGIYGGCAWLTGATSLQELEDGQAAANADADFLALIDRSGDCFVQGATTTQISRRIA